MNKSQKLTNKIPASSSKNETTLADISTLQEFEDHLLEIDISKPRTAKNIFTSEVFKKDFSTSSLIDAIPEINKLWSNLSDAKKKPYQEKADVEKQRYDDNLKLVREHLLKKPPKETATAYQIFMDEEIKNCIEGGMEFAEARKVARETWNNFSNNDKKAWEDKKEANKELYEKLKLSKPGHVSGYAIWVRDQIANAKTGGKKLTLKECGDNWEKTSAKIKAQYKEYAAQIKQDKENQKHLYEITFGIKPRKPLGAFIYFLQEVAKDKKVTGSSLFKTASTMWKALSPDKKEKYEKMSRKESLIYTLKMMEFKNFKKTTYKRVPNAYNLFVAEMREKLTEKDLADNKSAFEVLSEMWKKEKNKKKFVKKAEELKKENELKKEDYVNRVFDHPKRPKSGYQMYLMERMGVLKEKHEGKSNSDIFKLIAEEWKGLKEAQQDKWNAKALPGREIYKEKMKNFEKSGFYTLDEEEVELKTKRKLERSQRMKEKSTEKKKSSKKKK